MALVYRNPRHWRSPKNLTVDDVFPDWVCLGTTGGIFSSLERHFQNEIPWVEDVEATGLDIAYGQRSANKFIAPFVYKYINDDMEFVEDGVEYVLASVVAKYGQKWNHLWELYTAQYNPLDSYTMDETLTIEHEGEDSSSSTRTPNLTTRALTDEGTTTDGDNSSTTTYGKTETATHSGTSTTTDSRKGFNSSTFMGAEQSVTTPQTTDTTVDSGSDTTRDLVDESTTRNSDTTTTQTGTESTSSSGLDSYTDTHTKTRSGNMYRSPADLMKEDRDFWLDEYFSIVFADVDDILTLGVYSEAEISVKVY